jgi:mannose-6-phosphate isomerase-like protein (cupin superfamily)
MFLNKVCGFLTATSMAVAAVAAFAQQPAGNPHPPNVHQLQQPDQTVTYTSAADLEALIDRAKKESTDATPMVVGKILRLAPYTVNLEYRPAGESVHYSAGIHPREAELFYVLDGSGTLVTGGKLTADSMGIDGGESRKVSKGDYIFIPEGTPHGFSHVDQTLVLMSVHMPRPVPAQ